MERVCKICNKSKPLSEFYSRLRNGKVSYDTRCKECVKNISSNWYQNNHDNQDFKDKRYERAVRYRQESKRTLDGWIGKIYRAIRSRNRKNFNKELPFTIDEFKVWLNENYHDKLNNLFEDYIKHDCDKKLCPSIDRINDYDSYHFDNMQLMTWEENDIKGSQGEKNKISCAEVGKKYCSKEVIQYDKNHNELNRYFSTHEGQRQTGIDSSNIARACRNHTMSKGFYWEYA